MKCKGCHDIELNSKHSGQGVGPLFSKQELVVLPSGLGAQGHPHGSLSGSKMLVDHL